MRAGRSSRRSSCTSTLTAAARRSSPRPTASCVGRRRRIAQGASQVSQLVCSAPRTRRYRSLVPLVGGDLLVARVLVAAAERVLRLGRTAQVLLVAADAAFRTRRPLPRGTCGGL